MKVSIIIPTFKIPITPKTVKHCPVKYELILSQEFGLSYARNCGAKQAQYPFLIFFDDDIILDKKIWPLLLSVKPKSFAMLNVKDRCCSRVVVIHAKDYWNMNGFDENIKYSAEDIDFYLRALEAKLKYIPIPEKYAFHIKHKVRSKNYWMNIKIKFDHSYLLVKHGRAYADFWGGFQHCLFNWMRRPRTYMPTFFGFFYHLLRKKP